MLCVSSPRPFSFSLLREIKGASARGWRCSATRCASSTVTCRLTWGTWSSGWRTLKASCSSSSLTEGRPPVCWTTSGWHHFLHSGRVEFIQLKTEKMHNTVQQSINIIYSHTFIYKIFCFSKYFFLHNNNNNNNDDDPTVFEVKIS